MIDRPDAVSGTTGRGKLARTRFATRLAIMVERGWPLVLPLVIVAGLFLTVSWFGLFRLLPDAGRFAGLAVFCVAALAALYPLRHFRLPSPVEVDRRIERANALVHNPIAVQGDRPSGRTDGFAEALWREHQKRMASQLGRLGADMPRAGVPERDPWGLRAVAALLAVVAFAFSFGPFGGRVADAFGPRAMAETLPARIDAWVTPPAYTGKPPVFLTADVNRDTLLFTVPAGSDVALRVTGGSGGEKLLYTDAAGNQRELGAAAPKDGAAPAPAAQPSAAAQFAGKLDQDGVLELRSGEDLVRAWTFAVTPDAPPTIRFSADPKRAVNGSLELAYEIEDDYGAASASSVFALAEPPGPGARPLYGPPEMPLALPRRGGIAAKASRDLTEHVWAGVPVRLVLQAADAAGQEARSEARTFLMPERAFANPLARAVVEMRRILSLDANQAGRVVDLIDAVTLRPEDTFNNPSHYLGLMTGRTKLRMAATDDEMRGVADYLWGMALAIEDGSLTDAERRLLQAQEALKKALENGASNEEIERLMQELRQAMNEFLQEFAERAKRDPNMAQQMPQPGQEMQRSDLERMLDEIENMAKSGQRDQAQEMLSQLQEMMKNLQAQRQQGQQGQQNSEMRQQMDKLGEIMRRQQETMNETFRLDQMQRGQRQRGQDRGEQRGQQEGQQPGQQGEQGQGGMTPEEFAEALKQLQEGQGQLQGDLEALMKGLEGMGIQPGEGFGEAGEAMGEAEGALGEGQSERATGEQGRALEALRRGAQDMMQQMQQAMEGDQGGGEEGGRQQNADRDPLGRPRATTGPDFGDSVEVPDEIDVQRARQILEAIRKRLGNALSPALERDYLERLLEMR